MPLSSLSPLLRRMLLTTLLLSALALWWPTRTALTVHASSPVAYAQWQGTPALPGAAVASAPLHLPAELPAPVLERAEFDPFLGVPGLAVTPAKPVPALAPLPAMAPAPLVAAAPPMNYRYLGQMIDPAGRVWHYLARAEASFLVEAGSRLDDGYVVQAIDAAGVRLHHPATDVYAVIPVPLHANEVFSR